MIMDQGIAAVGCGILGILLAASIIGAVLSRTASSDQARATVANLNARVRAWWMMCALVFCALIAGTIATTILFALLSFLALREFITLAPTRRADHHTLFWAFFIIIPLQYWFVASRWYGMMAIFIPVWAFLFVAILVQLSDVFQYVWGKLLGRHRIAPHLSPNKTWEGFLGGVATATGIGAALWWMTPFTPLHAAGMALIITCMGFCGGIVMSAIKRDAGVKDFGAIIAGHGGVLDRIDSLCFAAPVFFHLVRYQYT